MKLDYFKVTIFELLNNSHNITIEHACHPTAYPPKI